MSETSAFVALSGISKAFSGVKVLKDVSFDVRPGEIHALLGENGAGKSTLIKILSGLYTADAGTVAIDGREMKFASTRDATAAGIATVYQELLLFPELSVAENVFLGNYPRKASGIIDWADVRRRTRVLLDSLETYDLDVDAKVLTLSVAQRQRVEIAKALSKNARVLIMDEPTASLVDADVHQLMKVVRQLRDRGVGIVYVSHRMSEIFALADRVTVLRDGAFVATEEIGAVDEAKLVSLMVGRSIESLFPKADVPIGETVLEVKNLNRGRYVRNISFALRKGEILGVAGLVGSGRTELALALFGMTPATSGEIRIDGKPVSIRSPLQARDLGIAYVPEDRGLQGLVKPMAIRKNVTMATLEEVSRGVFIKAGMEAARALAAVKRLAIRCRDIDQPAGELSGGNQQKVVIAKWLETAPRVLILDEPTRGVDVGAKSEIHAIMGKLVAQGVAILMISSELPEVVGMSDRVLVMSGGSLIETLERVDATPERLGAAMTAHAMEAGVMADTGVELPPVRPRTSARSSPLKRLMADYGQEIVVLAAILALFVVVTMVNPRFISPNNLTSIFFGNAYIAVAAIGMSMVIVTGNIDVSVGALIGVLATISGSLAVAGYPVWVAWFVPVLVGMAINGVIGILVAYGRIPSIVVTLGALSILRGGLISVTGGTWISNLPPEFLIAQKRIFDIPFPLIAMVVLTVLAALWMRYFPFGRSLYALGGNPEAAVASGIPAERRVVAVFVIHGFFAGLATILFATQLQVIQSTVPPNLELTIITASVIGGVSIMGGSGTVIGSTLAAILFATIGSALIFVNVSAYWLRAVIGLLILATVLADMLRRGRSA